MIWNLFIHYESMFFTKPKPFDQKRVIKYHIDKMNEIIDNGYLSNMGLSHHIMPQKIQIIFKEGERFFYTRENAIIIDTLREYIDNFVTLIYSHIVLHHY